MTGPFAALLAANVADRVTGGSVLWRLRTEEIRRTGLEASIAEDSATSNLLRLAEGHDPSTDSNISCDSRVLLLEGSSLLRLAEGHWSSADSNISCDSRVLLRLFLQGSSLLRLAEGHWSSADLDKELE